jgi:hypothetical protein
MSLTIPRLFTFTNASETNRKPNFISEEEPTKGRLFSRRPRMLSDSKEQSERLQAMWGTRWPLAQRIRERYAELVTEIQAAMKGEDAMGRLAAKYEISLEIVRQNLYSTGTGNPIPSPSP